MHQSRRRVDNRCSLSQVKTGLGGREVDGPRRNGRARALLGHEQGGRVRGRRHEDRRPFRK